MGEFNKLTEKEVDCWNNMAPFGKGSEGAYIIPNIPRCDKEDYKNVIVPNLIRCGAIAKDKLEVGKTYYGDCRNANEAMWNGEKFTYQRYKFGQCFQEEINHFEDDNGFDLFVPIEEKKD